MIIPLGAIIEIAFSTTQGNTTVTSTPSMTDESLLAEIMALDDGGGNNESKSKSNKSSKSPPEPRKKSNGPAAAHSHSQMSHGARHSGKKKSHTSTHTGKKGHASSKTSSSTSSKSSSTSNSSSKHHRKKHWCRKFFACSRSCVCLGVLLLLIIGALCCRNSISEAWTILTEDGAEEDSSEVADDGTNIRLIV